MINIRYAYRLIYNFIITYCDETISFLLFCKVINVIILYRNLYIFKIKSYRYIFENKFGLVMDTETKEFKCGSSD